MNDNELNWKYLSEPRTLRVTLPRVAWLALESILEQPDGSDTVEDLVAGFLKIPLEGFVAPAAWQRTWLDDYFGREKIEVARRAFEQACREFEEASK